MKSTPAQIEAAAKAMRRCNLHGFVDQDPAFLELAKAALTAAAEVADKSAYVEALNYAYRQQNKTAAEVGEYETGRRDGEAAGKVAESYAFAATIERCAQVVRRYTINIGEWAETIAAELQALKDET